MPTTEIVAFIVSHRTRFVVVPAAGVMSCAHTLQKLNCVTGASRNHFSFTSHPQPSQHHPLTITSRNSMLRIPIDLVFLHPEVRLCLFTLVLCLCKHLPTEMRDYVCEALLSRIPNYGMSAFRTLEHLRNKHGLYKIPLIWEHDHHGALGGSALLHECHGRGWYPNDWDVFVMTDHILGAWVDLCNKEFPKGTWKTLATHDDGRTKCARFTCGPININLVQYVGAGFDVKECEDFTIDIPPCFTQWTFRTGTREDTEHALSCALSWSNTAKDTTLDDMMARQAARENLYRERAKRARVPFVVEQGDRFFAGERCHAHIEYAMCSSTV